MSLGDAACHDCCEAWTESGGRQHDAHCRDLLTRFGLIGALKTLAQGWANGDGPTIHGDWYAAELLDVIGAHGEASAR